MAISEDAQAIINAINAESTAITNAISAQTTAINSKLDTIIDKENRVIRGMGLQGRALNASVSYKIKDPNGEQILDNLDNLNQ